MTQPPPPPPTDPPPGSSPPGGYQDPSGGYSAGYGQQPGYPAGGHEAGGYQPGGYQAGGYQAGGYQAGGYQAGYQPGDPAGYQGYGQPGYPAPPPPKKRPGWLLPVIIGGVLLLLCCIGGVVTAIVVLANSDSDPDPSPTTEAPAPDPEATDDDDGGNEPTPETAEGTYGAGTYEVGSEIPAGTYVTTVPDGPFDSCYFARLDGFSGDFDDIIANSNFSAGSRGRVEISSSDAGIEFSGTCEWTALSEAPPVDPGDEVGAGVWAVGDEVEPGTYRTEAPDGDFLNSCYWSRLSGFSGAFDDIITNGIIDAGSNGRVEIANNDTGIEFSGPCVWTRD